MESENPPSNLESQPSENQQSNENKPSKIDFIINYKTDKVISALKEKPDDFTDPNYIGPRFFDEDDGKYKLIIPIDKKTTALAFNGYDSQQKYGLPFYGNHTATGFSFSGNDMQILRSGGWGADVKIQGAWKTIEKIEKDGWDEKEKIKLLIIVTRELLQYQSRNGAKDWVVAINLHIRHKKDEKSFSKYQGFLTLDDIIKNLLNDNESPINTAEQVEEYINKYKLKIKDDGSRDDTIPRKLIKTSDYPPLGLEDVPNLEESESPSSGGKRKTRRVKKSKKTNKSKKSKKAKKNTKKR